MLITESQDIQVYNGVPLILSFDTIYLRQHFEETSDDIQLTDLSDEQVAEIGLRAMQSDGLYETFCRALRIAAKQVISTVAPSTPSTPTHRG